MICSQRCGVEKMCSNTSHSSEGGDTGGYGVDSMYSKKAKRQRVPKRGPGVAELEKILREQKEISDLDKIKNDGLFLFPPVSASYQPQSPTVPPPSNPLPKYFQLAPDPNKDKSPTATSHAKGSSAGSSDGSKTIGYFSRSSMFMSENPIYECSVDVEGALRSNSTLPFSMHLFNVPNKFSSPSSSIVQSSSPPSTMSLFPQSAAGLCHGIEPPSNQTSYHHYTSPEEDKMVGTKRSRPFSMEIPQIPSFRCPIPSLSPQMNRPDSSFLCNSRYIEPSEAVDPRDGKLDSYLMPIPSFKKCNPNYGAADENLLLFPCPPIHPSTTHTSRQERSKVQNFPPQERTDNSQQVTGHCGSVQKKPFYSFLLPLEQISKVDQNERIETRGDGIDLNLRL